MDVVQQKVAWVGQLHKCAFVCIVLCPCKSCGARACQQTLAFACVHDCMHAD